MIVCYDPKTGMISHCTLEALEFLEEISARYTKLGVSHVLTDRNDQDTIFTAYVKDGQVVQRPLITLTGENRPVKADGVDALQFQVDPPNAQVQVVFNEAVIHEGTLTDGKVEFSTDHTGTYTISIGAAFPLLGVSFAVEAI